MTTSQHVCPGDALVALGAKVEPELVSTLNRWGYDAGLKRLDWIATQIGSRDLAEKALAMAADCKTPRPARSRGLGDTIAKVTTAVGIRPCLGCKKRQELLNKLVPYKDNK